MPKVDKIWPKEVLITSLARIRSIQQTMRKLRAENMARDAEERVRRKAENKTKQNYFYKIKKEQPRPRRVYGMDI